MATPYDTPQAAATAYAEHAMLSQDPHYCAQILYTAAIEACRRARAVGPADRAAWAAHIGQAQAVAAAFHDLARSDTDPARLYKTLHRLIWESLTAALFQGDVARLDAAEAAFQECLTQLQAYVRQHPAPVDAAW